MKTVLTIFIKNAGSLRALLGMLLLSAAVATPAVANESVRAKQDIRLRAGPSLQSPELQVIRRGEVLTLIEEEGEFARLRTAQGLQGYFRTKYLVRTQAAAPAAVAAAPVAQAAPVTRAAVPAAPAAASSPAPAARAVAPAAASERRWTITGVAGASLSFLEAGDLQSAFLSSGINATVNSLDESAGLGGLRVAYALTDAIALEGGLLTLGRYKADLSVPGVTPAQVQDVLQREYPATGPGVTVAALFSSRHGAWTLTGRTGAFIGLGTEVDVNLGGQNYSFTVRQNSWLLGGGVTYAILPNWDLGLDLNAMDLNGTLLGAGVTLGVRL